MKALLNCNEFPTKDSRNKVLDTQTSHYALRLNNYSKYYRNYNMAKSNTKNAGVSQYTIVNQALEAPVYKLYFPDMSEHACLGQSSANFKSSFLFFFSVKIKSKNCHSNKDLTHIAIACVLGDTIISGQL